MTIRRRIEYSPNKTKVKCLYENFSIYRVEPLWKYYGSNTLTVTMCISAHKLRFLKSSTPTINKNREWSIGLIKFASLEHLPTLQGLPAPCLDMSTSLSLTTEVYRVLIKPNLDLLSHLLVGLPAK